MPPLLSEGASAMAVTNPARAKSGALLTRKFPVVLRRRPRFRVIGDALAPGKKHHRLIARIRRFGYQQSLADAFPGGKINVFPFKRLAAS